MNLFEVTHFVPEKPMYEQGEQISSGDDRVGPVTQRIRTRGYKPRRQGFESLLSHNQPKWERIFLAGDSKIT
ncbi:hypothetical protein E2542_SST25053 [Spatholobus suberectus]|nr:hypothetical protein E2542_SST25053 [Spatholobus suberectus]